MRQFLRKGVVGNWRDYLSPDQDARMDRWVADNNCGAPMVYLPARGGAAGRAEPKT